MSVRASSRCKRPLWLLSGGLLGASAALLVSCGSSGKLIPVANSEPLQKDFEEVARAAEGGHGSCSGTEAAIRKTERDFAGLPASLDAGLRRRLGEGMSKLREDALGLCAQPSTQTATTTTPRTTTSTTTSTSTTPPSTSTTPPTNTNTTTTTGPGGGTPAKEGEGEGEEASKHHDKGKGSEGAPAGGAAPEGGK
jgi:hypothetical protein